MTDISFADLGLSETLLRALNGAGPRFAALCQSLDEMRHAQTQIHTLSNYNKYYGGLHNCFDQFDKVWYLSVPKSFFEDAITGGPFEFITAISFSFEYVLTNLLFMPFVSGAAYNGDMATTISAPFRAARAVVSAGPLK